MSPKTDAETAIVDTNVILVADGKQPDIGVEGRRRCVATLWSLVQSGRIVLDSGGAILREYLHKTKPWNPQTLGEAFLKWVHDHQYHESRCDRVPITPLAKDSEDFKEFPRDERLRPFELADRKFVAVAITHPQHPPIKEASDTDCYEFRAVLEEYGVKVDFLCEDDLRRLFERKHPHNTSHAHDRK